MMPPQNLPRKIPAARVIRLPEAAVPVSAIRYGGFFLKWFSAIPQIPGGGSVCMEREFFANGRRCLEQLQVKVRNLPLIQRMPLARCGESDAGSQRLRLRQWQGARST